jgi:predicted transposase YdaD
VTVSHFDRLFRRIFSTPEAKADLARNVLPSRYLDKIRLESLQSEDESFIDEELKEHFTDLLMSFELKVNKTSEQSVPDGQSAGPTTDDGGGVQRKNRRAGSRSGTQSHGSRLYLYLLVDHKSRPYRWAALQLLRYVSTIYNKILRDHQVKNKELPPEQKQPPPEKMPEVVPVVFYHGTEDWNSPPRGKSAYRASNRRGGNPYPAL